MSHPWYWRMNMGGSGHLVREVEVTDNGPMRPLSFTAKVSSPCGQAQGTTARFLGTVLEDPERRPVYQDTACSKCLAYAQRHGLSLPGREASTVAVRLAPVAARFGIDPGELLALIEGLGLQIRPRS